MKVKLSFERLTLALFSAVFLIGCANKGGPTNADSSMTKRYTTSGSVVKYSELPPVSQGAAEKGHPAPVMGVQHYFGEEHGGIHGGPQGEPTQ